KPIYSIAQHAKQQEKNVGIITSVSIDHATPSAFYAHQPHRSMNYEIALDAAKSDFDFFGGAGFLQLQKDSTSTNALTILQDSNYFIAKGIDSYNRDCEKIILLQDFEKSNLDFAIDREDESLSLSKITTSAIDFLSKNDHGFFLMIEGGLIDWACHSNDAATVFAEVEDLSNTVCCVLDFYRQHPDETLIILTADHETGGLSLGTGEYKLNLKVLEHQKKSAAKLNELFNEMIKEKGKNICWEDAKNFLEHNFGFWKNVDLTTDETNELKNIFEKKFLHHQNTQLQILYLNGEQLIAKSVKILNNKANVGWSSYGHSAGFVPVYAIGVGSERIQGIMDNTDFYKILTNE
ncbi:MAG: alkaline phosphatase, partial [Paludibacteraceae bacterium]|nr:alkaline phosphatase [Paludibacteraceae bacterium]